MTVHELIGELSKVEDRTRTVMLQGDPEGNYYRRLHSVWEDAAAALNWDEVGIEALTPDLEREGFTELDVVEGHAVLVLVPE